MAMVRCKECEGSGRQECLECRGRGRISCPRCYGTGLLRGWPMGCPDCNNGVRSCPYCIGKPGRSGRSCDDCNGTGWAP